MTPRLALPPTFYQQPTLQLARALIGKRLIRICNGVELEARIVEVEAYHQDGDRACHAYAGKTARNAAMFGPAGHLYVYFIYGMHYCMNVVSEAAGTGAAVLIRAMEPLSGLETMHANRPSAKDHYDLCRGPAKCCQSFAIDKKMDGQPLGGKNIWLASDTSIPTQEIREGARIGISKSEDLLWRFWHDRNAYVSRN